MFSTYVSRNDRVIIPKDLCALDDLTKDLLKVRYDISYNGYFQNISIPPLTLNPSFPIGHTS